MSLLQYRPPPTVEKFMLSGARVRVIVGPLGSGKSMGAIMELLRKACEQEPYNGVRYTRFVCVRNTLGQLRQTVLADIKQYLAPIVSFYATDSTAQIRCVLPDGTKVHCDLMLIPLDTKEDVRRLLSLQITGGWINECREVDMAIVAPLLGRTGRYPSKAMGGATWRGIIADSNPWTEDSEWHDALVLHPKPGWQLFHQGSGIGPNAENVENLPDGYYSDLVDGKDSDFQAVHVESQWGTSNAGQAVFRKSFNASQHARDIQPVTNPHKPLIIGLDLGRTPTALICQTDNYGRLVVYKEVVSTDMGLIQFLSERLLPALSMPPFVGRSVVVVADPAGNQRSQLSDETPFTALKAAGLSAYPASTNDIGKRLMAVERLLMQFPAGEPGLQISRDGCPTLITALGSKYKYKKKRDGQLEEVPDKSHPHSDLADALQYACLGVQQNIVARHIVRSTPIARREPMPVGAWT